MAAPVVIVDYDAGNIRSVTRALERAGAHPHVTAAPADILSAYAIVMPGVGAAGDTMFKLRERGLEEPIREAIASGTPFLGVCMGLQALFDSSEEGGPDGQQCLGVLPGRIRHFTTPGCKVPHMGWNTVDWVNEHPVVARIPSGSYFYFVHSFYPEPAAGTTVIGETEYGHRFASVVAKDNVVATQFHPEKSADCGLALYAGFLEWAQ